MLRISLFVAISLAGCNGNGPTGGADGGPIVGASQGQGSLPRGALVVNEVSAKPGSGESDWIEIYNRSADDIDLCNYFITDSLDRLDHYLHLGGSPPPAVCVPQFLAPASYMVIYADDESIVGPNHAPFRLGPADEAHIVTTEGEAIDSLIFLYPSDASGLSLAREPNGEGLFWLNVPSQGQENPDNPDVGEGPGL